MEWYGLTTREWASVFWAVVLLVVGVATPFVRRAFAPVIRTLRTFWQLHLAVVAFIGWVALVCYSAHLLGAWDTDLLKDTVAWVLVYGIASIFSTTKAAKDDHFFRHAVLAALSVSAAMQFILNLHTFHFAVELFLQPVVTFLILLEGVAGTDARTRPAQRLVHGLLAIIGVWIVVATAWGLWGSWRGIDPEEAGLAFAFSLWFPVATLPFVYALSLVMTYVTVLRLSSFRNDGRAPPLLVKVAMLVGMRGNLRVVNDLPKHHAEYRAIARSKSFREALKNVHAYQVAREERRQEKEAKAARLVHYAGVKGQDDDGKLLDQREFKETRDALRWIHTCQMGWHNNLSHYRRDLMTILGDFERQGLPAEHGITMRVSKSGQAWYAWRRTVTGYVFGIGANGPTPNEWLYEGEEPPKGFPGHDSSWGQGPFNTPPNWW
jgi:hypothetical protein